jgi:hypothetical protein
LWGIASFDLHLSNENFWNLCPIEFDALLERWVLQEERLDRRAALVASILVNINRTKKSKISKLQEFMVHDFRGKSTQQTWEQQLEMLKALQPPSKKNTGMKGQPTTELPLHT